MPFSQRDIEYMRRALTLARQGEGYVEPNPMVGCLIVQGSKVVGQGWHQRFGEAHAEVNALAEAGGEASGGTMFVTLEPCCHQGKTPPCTEAVIRSGIRRVLVAQSDPFAEVAGGGIQALRKAGIEVEVGLLEREANALTAPFRKLVERGSPWIIAKWAMTLDGKIATTCGDSRWISSESSRRIVHQLRGRVDAILIGRGTADADDPLLTARPAGPRTAVRIVLDTRASLSENSQLVRTASEIPLLVVVGSEAESVRVHRLERHGCEILVSRPGSPIEHLSALFQELGERKMTNLLVEGGGALLGTLLDGRLIDEIHAFVAPKIVGGVDAKSPIAGHGISAMAHALQIDNPIVEQVDRDVYIHGRPEPNTE